MSVRSSPKREHRAVAGSWSAILAALRARSRQFKPGQIVTTGIAEWTFFHLLPRRYPFNKLMKERPFCYSCGYNLTGLELPRPALSAARSQTTNGNSTMFTLG